MADRRGQAEAYAKHANGVFLLKEEYEKLLSDQKRMRDLEQQLTDIAEVQGQYRESTSPFNVFRRIIQKSPVFRRRPPQSETIIKTYKTTDELSSDPDSKVEK